MHEHVEAYLLGALESEERARFEVHLRGCQLCTDESASYAAVLRALRSTPVAAPPPPPRVHVLRMRPVAYAAAAAALLVALSSVTIPPALHYARTIAEYEAIMAMLASNPREVALYGQAATGRALVGGGNRRTGFLAHGLPPAAAGMVYRVWILAHGTRLSPGTLESAPGDLHVLVVDGNALRDARLVRIMLEPAQSRTGAERTLMLQGRVSS